MLIMMILMIILMIHTDNNDINNETIGCHTNNTHNNDTHHNENNNNSNNDNDNNIQPFRSACRPERPERARGARRDPGLGERGETCAQSPY